MDTTITYFLRYTDQYKDDHPVFNRTVMATIKISVKPEDLAYILTPWNAFNASVVPATVNFDNGDISETLEEVGLKIQGKYGREHF